MQPTTQSISLPVVSTITSWGCTLNIDSAPLETVLWAFCAALLLDLLISVSADKESGHDGFTGGFLQTLLGHGEELKTKIMSAEATHGNAKYAVS